MRFCLFHDIRGGSRAGILAVAFIVSFYRLLFLFGVLSPESNVGPASTREVADTLEGHCARRLVDFSAPLSSMMGKPY